VAVDIPLTNNGSERQPYAVRKKQQSAVALEITGAVNKKGRSMA